MLEFFAKLKLNSIIDKNPTKKTKRFLSWNDISSMAIIIESNKNLNKNNLDEFIEKTGKFVEVFYVETNNKQATFGDWNCFTKKDLTFLKLCREFFFCLIEYLILHNILNIIHQNI